ncbi:hypothetical protein PoB_006596000 [Plakobranchus ocellatus]|uniref:Uncharacterized protein n=1 Tax=Plakobranchus ocellatus TaxID=259542 RepID=A0AAV4D5T8_9GAST|nr:hypothetical protein PoB_006596000 [Plakobranchus ocellatus]
MLKYSSKQPKSTKKHLLTSKQQLLYTPARKTLTHPGAARDSTNLKANNGNGETTNKFTNQEIDLPDSSQVNWRRGNSRARRIT